MRLLSFGDSIGNRLDAGDGPGRPVAHWKFGAGAAAMMGRGR